jgi:2-oxoglutarate ferredoxin oxidoreductase subunit alpha
MLLSDGYLANGAEPWPIPSVDELPDLRVDFTTEPNGATADGTPEFLPYLRDPETLARPWAVPGTRACSTASAGWRRPTGAATSPTTRQPRPHDPAAAGQGRRHRRGHPPTDVDDPTVTPGSR